MIPGNPDTLGNSLERVKPMPTIQRIKAMEDVWGRTRIQGIILTGDANSYNQQSPTGLGYPIYASPLGFKVLHGARILGIAGTLANSGGLIPVIDVLTLASTLGICLRFFYPSGGSVVPAAIAIPSGVIPTGATPVDSTSAQPAITMTAGLGVQVANGTDLSTVAVKLELTGL